MVEDSTDRCKHKIEGDLDRIAIPDPTPESQLARSIPAPAIDLALFTEGTAMRSARRDRGQPLPTLHPRREGLTPDRTITEFAIQASTPTVGRAIISEGTTMLATSTDLGIGADHIRIDEDRVTP